MTWTYVMPTWLFATVSVLVIGGGSVVVHWFLHLRGWRGFREHNDITGFILTIVGAIYAVILGFVAIVVWEQYEGSRQNEQREINQLASLYHLAGAFQTPQRERLRSDVLGYVNIVIGEEWPAMRQGEESLAARQAAERVVDDVIAVQTGPNSNAASQALTLSAGFMDARRLRIQDNRSGIPILLWVTLLFGGVITLGLGYLFGIENEKFHATATGCTAAIIAIILVLIARLDYPYRGDTGIPSTDWQLAAQALPRLR